MDELFRVDRDEATMCVLDFSDHPKYPIGITVAQHGALIGNGIALTADEAIQLASKLQQAVNGKLEADGQRDWAARWYGSDPMKGSHIHTVNEHGGYGEAVAFVGATEEHHAQADKIVMAHNASLARLREVAASEVERVRLTVINSPETADFIAGVPLEAAHQRERWGTSHDEGKSPYDWFWLIGYLAQKAADAAVRGDVEKAKHHTISTAAALGNWHAALTGANVAMRPGINASEGGGS